MRQDLCGITSDDNPKIIASYDEPTASDFLTTMDRWCQKGFWSKSALSDTDSTKRKWQSCIENS